MDGVKLGRLSHQYSIFGIISMWYEHFFRIKWVIIIADVLSLQRFSLFGAQYLIFIFIICANNRYGFENTMHSKKHIISSFHRFSFSHVHQKYWARLRGRRGKEIKAMLKSMLNASISQSDQPFGCCCIANVFLRLNNKIEIQIVVCIMFVRLQYALILCYTPYRCTASLSFKLEVLPSFAICYSAPVHV